MTVMEALGVGITLAVAMGLIIDAAAYRLAIWRIGKMSEEERFAELQRRYKKARKSA